jgi:hypothetical protein
MKIRNGFVSNSSSSSFIVGVAKINDYNEFEKYLENNNIKLNYEVKVMTLSNIKESNSYDMHVNNDRIYVDSFQTDVSLNIKDCKDEDLFLIVNICNNEGDSYFMTSDDDYDIDYDIDMSFFDIHDSKVYDAFYNEESGLDLSKSEVYYGAGRNG